MWNRLVPQEYQFYDLFEEAAGHAVNAAQLLVRLTENFSEADPLTRELHAVEHACDNVAHTTIERLNKSFITPLDREDIHELILKMDDVVDLIYASANRMNLYNIGQPTKHAVNMAKQVVRGTEKMADAVKGMRSTKLYEQVQRDCIAMHETENAGDEILQLAMADLFEGTTDPMVVIKWKDIYEKMELITDRIEDVANVLQGVIVKMT